MRHRPCQTLCTPRRGHSTRYGTLIPNCYLSPPMALLVSSQVILLVLKGHVLGLRRFPSPKARKALGNKGFLRPCSQSFCNANERLLFAQDTITLAYGESH